MHLLNKRGVVRGDEIDEWETAAARQRTKILRANNRGALRSKLAQRHVQVPLRGGGAERQHLRGGEEAVGGERLENAQPRSG